MLGLVVAPPASSAPASAPTVAAAPVEDAPRPTSTNSVAKSPLTCLDSGARRTVGGIRFACQATPKGLQWVPVISVPSKVVHDIRNGQVRWSYSKKSPKAIQFQVQVLDTNGAVILTKSTPKAGKKASPTTLRFPADTRGGVRVRAAVAQKAKNPKKPKILYSAWSNPAEVIGYAPTPADVAEDAWDAIKEAAPDLDPVAVEQTPLGSTSVLPTTPNSDMGLVSPDGYDLTLMPPTVGNAPAAGDVTALQLPNGVSVFGSQQSTPSVAVFADRDGRFQVAVTTSKGASDLRGLSIPLLTSSRLGAVVQQDGTLTLQRLLQADHLGTPQVEPDVWETVYTVTASIYDGQGTRLPVIPVVQDNELQFQLPASIASGVGTYVLMVTYTQESDALGFYLDVAQQWNEVQALMRRATKRGTDFPRSRQAAVNAATMSFTDLFDEWLAANLADKKALPRRYVSLVDIGDERYLNVDVQHLPTPSGEVNNENPNETGVNRFTVAISNQSAAPIERDGGNDGGGPLRIDVGFIPPRVEDDQRTYEEYGAFVVASPEVSVQFGPGARGGTKWSKQQGCSIDPGVGPDYVTTGTCEVWVLDGQVQPVELPPDDPAIGMTLNAQVRLHTNGSHVEDVQAAFVFYQLSDDELQYKHRPLPILMNPLQKAFEQNGSVTYDRPTLDNLGSIPVLNYSSSHLTQAQSYLQSELAMLANCGIAAKSDAWKDALQMTVVGNGYVEITVDGVTKRVKKEDYDNLKEATAEARAIREQVNEASLDYAFSSNEFLPEISKNVVAFKEAISGLGLVFDAEEIWDTGFVDPRGCAHALAWVELGLGLTRIGMVATIAFQVMNFLTDWNRDDRIRDFYATAGLGACWWMSEDRISSWPDPTDPEDLWTYGEVRYTREYRDTDYVAWSDQKTFGLKCTGDLPSDLAGTGVRIVEDEVGGVPGQWARIPGLVPGQLTWILSTGLAAELVGDPSDDLSTIMGGPGSDALTQLVGFETLDAAFYRAEVVPSGKTLYVDYVFATEEFPKWIGSEYNDVMAVFVEGENCAVVSGQPVSVNSINPESNAHLFVDNLEGAPGYRTAMNGLTIPLHCEVPVVPGKPVTVEIAVADASDGEVDSAVVLLDQGIRSE